MPIQHTLKRTWSGSTGATPISYSVIQQGNVEANLDPLVAPGQTISSAIAITRSTLQSFFLCSSQQTTVSIGGGNAKQTLTPGGTIDPTDHFNLIWSGQTTAGTFIFSSTSAAAIQAGLEALSNIGAGNVQVTGPNAGPWVVEFIGALGLGPRATITSIIATVASAVMPITVTTVGTVPTQVIPLAAGVPQDWTRDDGTANPLTGDVAKMSFYVPGPATAQCSLRCLFN